MLSIEWVHAWPHSSVVEHMPGMLGMLGMLGVPGSNPAHYYYGNVSVSFHLISLTLSHHVIIMNAYNTISQLTGCKR